jgi:signal transduction histidine kinase
MRPPYLIAIIGVALAFVVGVDIRGASVAEEAVDEVLNDATRSIELVEDIRWQVHQLGRSNPDDIARLVTRLDQDITAYAPLATYTGEAAAWAKVRDALALARDAAISGDLERVRFVTRSVSADVNALVEINHREAAADLHRMRTARSYELAGDIVAVAVAALVLALLARALFRSQERQRELVLENLDRAEQRNRELDAFAGRAAHDLRSPLNPIRGYAELIATDPSASPDTRRQASLITKGVMRMTRVIDDMLALSRAGHPDKGEVGVAATLDHVREELDADLRDVRLTVDVDGAIVACSESSLEQILRNLLGNASKYRSGDRALEIDVTARRLDTAVRIEVADNGVGMDDEARVHAFDPFFRARRDIAGTGLGLSIVERIVRTSGGTCELVANEPSGTRVVIHLPLAADRGASEATR